jgi:F-type H+-transporting ATPase subunit alpha
MSVPQQIAVLAALTEKLFDPVPLDRMTEAGQAVADAAAKIPPDIRARFEAPGKFSDEDRDAILALCRVALERFHHE